MKTLAIILHHNTIQYTDQLYELLAPEQLLGNYDLIVIDNGSEKNKISKYTTYKLNENTFFGGALNASVNLIIENEEYDSLLFLNNDLIINNNFVLSLRNQLNKFDIISPCIIQPEKQQNHWKQMLSWGTNTTRYVKWTDLQCPLISRRFIQYIHNTKSTENYIDPLLIRGWGIEILFGIICETLGWKIGVCDFVPAVHLGSMTMKSLGNSNEYCQLAEQGMRQFFNKNNLMKEFNEMTWWAENYDMSTAPRLKP